MTATTIRLSGALGKRYGRNHLLHLDSQSPAEAIRALCALLAGFRQYLVQAKSRGIEFAVFRGRGRHCENINESQLHEPAGGCITVSPVLCGSKTGGLLQTIVGAALIVAGSIGSTLGLWTTGSVWGPELIGLGISLASGGIVQMLSPQPRLGKNADNAGNQPSYVFSGAVNTTAQGNPVPVLYGRMIVGSAVVSAGIEADEYSAATDGVGTGTVNGSQLASPYQRAT